MKKFLALILALAMVLAVAACGSEPNEEGDGPVVDQPPVSQTDEEQPSEQTDNGPVNTDPVKIGVIFYSKDDSLGQLVYSYLNYAAEVIDNLEVQWVFGSFDTNSQLADAQNLISAGVDGIMALTLDDLAIQQIASLCNENEVYFQVMFRMPSSEETQAVLDTYDYYVGYAIEDTMDTSYETIRLLSDMGLSKIGVGGNNHSGTSVLRMSGMEKGCEDFNIDVLAQFDIGNDTSGIQTDVQNILDSYPDVEAIWSMSGSQGIAEIIVNTLRAHKQSTGKEVGFITFDPFDGMAEAFDDGILYGSVGGQAPLCLQAFAALYNAIDGHPLSEEKVGLLFPFLILTSSEDLNFFETYYNNTEVQIYDENIIKSMLYRYNQSVTLDELETLWSSYSMDWIRAELDSRAK